MIDTPTSRFISGTSTGVVGSAGAALVDAPPDDAVVAIFANCLVRNEDLETLIASLLQVGLPRLPAFVAVARVDGGYRLLLRGHYLADAKSAAGTTRLTAGEVSLWREEVLETLSSVVLSVGSAPSILPFTVGAGTVPAGALEWCPSEVGGPSISDALPAEIALSSNHVSADMVPRSTEVGLPGDADDPAAVGRESAENRVVDAVDESRPAPSDAELTEVRSPEPEPEPELTSDGLTVVRVRLADEQAAKEVKPLIDEVPSGLRVSEAFVAGGAPATSSDPDHDGRTEIRRPNGPPSLTPLVLAEPGQSAPTVHAVMCPSGHPNPVTQAKCRQCESDIVERLALTIPRPPLGLLRFSTNEVVEVDGPIAIGRMPPTDPIGGSHPEPVAIENSELSRFHALVTVNDWFVYVADQDSTNGTSVAGPGREPVTCRAHEPMQLHPGSLVNLGGVVTFRFDVI